jgi:hypothetical protein
VSSRQSTLARGLVWLLATLLVGSLLAACGSASVTVAEDRANADSTRGYRNLPCSRRIERASVLTVSRDTSLDREWAAYADSGQGWNGGDSVHAYKLEGGRILWTFADSFVGPLGPHLTRNPRQRILHSVFVLQRGIYFRTITGGTPEKPEPLVWFPGTHQDFMALAGAMELPSRFQELFMDDKVTAHGRLIEEPRDTLVATFSAKTLKLLGTKPLSDPSSTVLWGSAVFQGRRWIYVYGASAYGANKQLYVAKVGGDNLNDPWLFWDGSGWSDRQSKAKPVLSAVSAEVSVSKFDGMYVVVTTPTFKAYSNRVWFYFGCAPTGPFLLRSKIADTYYTGRQALSRFGLSDVYVYDAMDQQALNHGDHWVISYDRNVTNFPSLFRNALVYRPAYLQVTLGFTRGRPARPMESG